jgi:hypothetical protein
MSRYNVALNLFSFQIVSDSVENAAEASFYEIGVDIHVLTLIKNHCEVIDSFFRQFGVLVFSAWHIFDK